MEILLKEYLPFWNKLNDEERTILINNSHKREYKKGEQIHRSDDDCLGLVIVKSGRLRVYASSDEGREITLYRLIERDICLFSASCMMKDIDFDIFVTSEESGELIIISAKIYKELSESSLPVAVYTNALMATRFSEIMKLLDRIQNKKLDSRLCALLLQEMEFGGGIISLTHEQLANHLGTAREVVTRMLKFFQTKGLIGLKRGSVELIKVEEIKKLAADCDW